jgi:uncharacterized cupin superfamily protein
MFVRSILARAAIPSFKRRITCRMNHPSDLYAASSTVPATKASFQPPIASDQIPPQTHVTTYPAEFAASVQGRTKRRLGNYFGLENFGVNLTTLEPGSSSSLQHHHKTQDEFVYILQGSPTLHVGEHKILMKAGECIGFPKNQGVGHCLVNESSQVVVYLEMGDRSQGDVVHYPNVDLMAQMDDQSKFVFTHKDGTPYSTSQSS